MTATVPNTSFVTGGPLTTRLIRVSVTRATSPFLYQVGSQTGYDEPNAAGHGNLCVVGDDDQRDGTVGLRMREDAAEHRGVPLADAVAELTAACAPPR